MLTDPKFKMAVDCFTIACFWSRTYNADFTAALKEYGDIGSDISGSGRYHFPEHVKDGLRQAARNVRFYSDAGHAVRPKRVRHSTMRHIASLVATRDGSGFYGPQPYTESNQ